MATKVTTLKNADKTEDLVARTQLKAIFDKNGDYIDNDLLASDLNKLKGGVVDELVICTEDEVGVPIPVNADLLNGHADTYFMGIEDSGTGYIRFANGLQICWGQETLPNTNGTVAGETTHSAVNYGKAFISNPSLVISSIDYAGNYYVIGASTTTTSFTYTTKATASFPNGTTYQHWIAIGTWK